jgi:predicted AlkP superfamily phosphohydrolase/phosphomutase
MNRKVFIFAIDSIDPDVLLAMARSGSMPTLRSLLDESLWAYTDNSPCICESTWSNFVSAVNPARHGRYFHSQIEPGSYRTRLFHATDVQAPPYWSRLSQAGRRVIVVDVPKSCVTPSLNGIQIVNWATHDQEDTQRNMTWPPELAGELERRFGADPVGANDYGGNGPRDIAGYRAASVANVARKTRLATTLMQELDWDHFLLVYDDGHHVGHYTWHLHDTAHPEYDSALRERLGDPLEAVCSALDQGLQEIRARLGRDAVLVFYSSHGIGPNYQATYILDSLLRRLEGASEPRRYPVNSLRALWRSLPLKSYSLMTPLQNSLRNLLLASDRRRRKAFALPGTDDAGLIRVNLAGREPHGRVQPGVEYARFCDELEERLLALTNAETGAPVVERITRVAEVCDGPLLDRLPDLCVHWNRAGPIRAVQGAGTGTLHMPPRNSRKGIHTPRGLILVRTADGRSGYLPQDVSVLDIAPTLCSWSGVGLEGVDGRVHDGLYLA